MSDLYRISELISKAEMLDEDSRKQAFEELEWLADQLQEVTKVESR